MAIHPYPIELVSDATLRDGTSLHVRPIRPEDAELERAFVDGLSEQTRYFRFFYRLHELTPAMLARFTQVDYDREMALVAIDDGGAAKSRPRSSASRATSRIRTARARNSPSSSPMRGRAAASGAC